MRRVRFNTTTPAGQTVVLPKPAAVPMKVLARVSSLPRGKEGFMQWFAAAHPEIFTQIEVREPDTVRSSGETLGDTDTTTPQSAAATGQSPSWVETIKAIALPALQVYQQKKVLDIQLQRAQNNQPPLDILSYTGDNSIRAGLDSSTQRTLLIAVGVLAGGFLLHRYMGRA